MKRVVQLGRTWPMLVAFFAVGTVMLVSWSYTVDDAFIVARYARNLGSAGGYAMNRGEPSDGVTGPLWLLPPLAAFAAGADPLRAMKLTGALCGVLAIGLALGQLLRRARGTHAAAFAAILVASMPDVGVWSVAGLETPLAMLAACVLAWAVARRPAPAAELAGLALAALAWLRPELALFGGVLLAALATRSRPAALRALALAATGALALLAFRWHGFDALLPLSARAKPADLSVGLAYAARAMLLTTSLVGLALAWRGARVGRAADAWLGVALLAHLVAVALAGGDWMPGSRLLVPVLPLYAVLAGQGAEHLARRKPRLAAACVALACAVPLADLATRLPELESTRASREGPGRELARELRAHSRVVALVDVGYLAYASGVRVIDLGGLTDPRIARMPGAHLDKRIDAAWLRARDPDTIVLHSRTPPRVGAEGRLLALEAYPVEQRVAHMPWVSRELRVVRVVPYAPDYTYVVLRRDAREP